MASADILQAPARKIDWAEDEDEEIVSTAQPKIYTDENGLKVVVEIRENDQGQKVRITRRIKSTLHREHVNHAVAERKRWAKFGLEKGHPPGPDVATTTVGEQIFLKLFWAGGANVAAAEAAAAEHAKQDESDEQRIREQLKGKKILCRICKGDHFTTKCPYKDTLQPLEEIESGADKGAESSGAATPAGDGKSGGRYIAPHMRGAAGKDMGMGDRPMRDDTNTLRVTNLSGDTREDDVRDLFRPFGQIARVFLAKDRETYRCKGFAFVTFVMREDAAKAQKKLDGHGYDNLILRVEWAKLNPDGK